VEAVVGNKLLVRDLEKWFPREDGTPMKVLDKVSFEVEANAITCIVGPSGCGKTTLLNMLAGLEDIDGGTVESVVDGGGQRRKPTIGYVFQNARLLPWKRVNDNIKLALKGAKVPREEWEHRATKYLELVGLLDFREQYPLYLSGGMRQRVALARALAVEADLVLMDEPFASVDELTAVRLREQTRELCKQLGCTVLFVTHNLYEASYVSDYVVILTARPARAFQHVAFPNPHHRVWGAPDMYEFARKLEEIVMALEE
jgi:ABC-type nitrate/sulfonate/bicarbonate transport system ATPase subunit